MLTGRSCGSTCAMSLPSSRMRPSSGVSKPASIRNSVVLPQPLGPSSAKNSPALMSSDSRSTALTAPNFFTTASMRSSGMSASLACGSGRDNTASAPVSGKSSAMIRVVHGGRAKAQRVGPTVAVQTGVKATARLTLMQSGRTADGQRSSILRANTRCPMPHWPGRHAAAVAMNAASASRSPGGMVKPSFERRQRMSSGKRAHSCAMR